MKKIKTVSLIILALTSASVYAFDHVEPTDKIEMITQGAQFEFLTDINIKPLTHAVTNSYTDTIIANQYGLICKLRVMAQPYDRVIKANKTILIKATSTVPSERPQTTGYITLNFNHDTIKGLVCFGENEKISNLDIGTLREVLKDVASITLPDPVEIN